MDQISPPQRIILHVDMDAFYASVEVLDSPSLQGQAVVVGGLGPRGVVATANYAAREYGVHSALPMARARRLCPHAHFLRPRMERYREVSAAVFEIFQSFTPRVEGLSLDEAFLDVSASQRLFGNRKAIAQRVKAAIFEGAGLTASVGVAHNKFLAKLASDLQKPDGLVCVPADKVQQFLDPMPIGKLWGIGPRTAPKLKTVGILTFGQLRQADPSILATALGNRAEHFRQLAAGEDNREVISDHADKSISHEVTFPVDVRDHTEMLAELQALVEAVASRLRQRQLVAQTVVVKIRSASFETITRSRSMRAGSNSTMTLYRMVRALFESWWAANLATPVRLLGVGVSSLEHRLGEAGMAGGVKGSQLGSQADSQSAQRLDGVIDTINARYGNAGLVHGLTLRRRRDENGESQ
jgi:DNA polymerase-4